MLLSIYKAPCLFQGPLNVTLYEEKQEKHIKIVSSQIEPTLTTENLIKSNESLLIKLDKKLHLLHVENDYGQINGFIDNIDKQFNSGVQTAKLSLHNNLTTTINVPKESVEKILQLYTHQSCRLIEAILIENNLKSSNLNCIYYSSNLYPLLIGEMLRKNFSSLNKESSFEGHKDVNALLGAVLLVYILFNNLL